MRREAWNSTVLKAPNRPKRLLMFSGVGGRYIEVEYEDEGQLNGISANSKELEEVQR